MRNRNSSMMHKNIKGYNLNEKDSLSKKEDYKLCETTINTLMASYEEIVNIFYKKLDPKIYDGFIAYDFSKKNIEDLLSQTFTQLVIASRSYKLLKNDYIDIKDFNLKITRENLENLKKNIKRNENNKKLDQNNHEKFYELIKFAIKLFSAEYVEDSFSKLDLNLYKSKYIVNKKEMGEKELTTLIPSCLTGVNDIAKLSNNLGKSRTDNPIYNQNLRNEEIFWHQKKKEVIRILEHLLKLSKKYNLENDLSEIVLHLLKLVKIDY